MYLAGNSRPDIQFAVHQCAKYTANPKHSHEKALKRVGRYLKGTRDQGLILDPKKDDLGIDMFVDADFAGMHGYEDPEDPASVKNRTGFVITIAKCPVIWASRMQTETALSTMMAEYIALSHVMRELLPFKRLAKEVVEHMGLGSGIQWTVHGNTVVHEDNNGALILANLPAGRSTPTSKFFNVKYHWFREKLVEHKIKIVKVQSDLQLADIFTKGFRSQKFAEMRKKLCGWIANTVCSSKRTVPENTETP